MEKGKHQEFIRYVYVPWVRFLFYFHMRCPHSAVPVRPHWEGQILLLERLMMHFQRDELQKLVGLLAPLEIVCVKNYTRYRKPMEVGGETADPYTQSDALI